MDSFHYKPCVASEFAHDDFTKSNHFGYIDNDDNDDHSFVLTSCQCEKRANENKIGDSTLAFFATTQHTLSTFCSTEGDDDDDDDDLSGCWNDDEISLGSFNDGYQFDSHLQGLDDSVDAAEPNLTMINSNNASVPQPTYIAFNNSIVKGNNQENSNQTIYHGDVHSSFHCSQESLFRDSFQHQQQRDYSSTKQQGLNDSMTSLSEAFEKLDYCMLRTAQSRKLVRQLTEKLALSSSIATLPRTGAPTTTTSTTTAVTAAAPSMSTTCSILRSNSSGSLTCSSSVSSRNHHRKGPKSLHKSRRHVNKATLSNKTGVAIRTLLNASFS